MKKKSLWIFLAVLIIVAASAVFLFLQSSSPEHSVKHFFKSFKAQDKESMRHVYTADILSLTQNRLEAAVASGIDASIEQSSATAENLPKKQDSASADDLPKEREHASAEDLPKENLSSNAPNDQTEADQEKESSAMEKHDNKANEKYDSKDIVSEAQKKIFDFEYDIKSSEVSGNQASVVVEITSYELGKAYREWYLESKQIKFSGEGSSGRKNGRKNIALRLNLLEQKFKESTKTYKSVFEIKLTKKHGDWIVSDMGDSYEFLRAVSGAFIYS